MKTTVAAARHQRTDSWRRFENLVSRIRIVRGHPLWPVGLDRDSIVVDLGANRGEFSSLVHAAYGCRCIAVEPRSVLFAQIDDPAVHKMRLAITGSDGPVELHVSDEVESSSLYGVSGGTEVGTESLRGVTLETLCRELALERIDLLKVDIEGAEIPMLDAADDDFLRRIGQISIEFHDHCGLTPIESVHRACERLRRLGFVQIKLSKRSYMTLLFINGSRHRVSRLERFYIQHVANNVGGAMRLLMRLASFPRRK